MFAINLIITFLQLQKLCCLSKTVNFTFNNLTILNLLQ